MDRTFIARVLESYFRHRWLNLVPLFLMVVGAVVWLAVSKPEYTSRGVVYVQGGTLLASLTADSNSPTGWSTAAKATSDDLNSLLQSDSFVRAVISQSNLEPEMSKGPRVADQTVKKVREAVWTETLGHNMVLIGAVYTSPTIAQQLSNGVIQNYLQWRLNTGNNEGVTAQTYFEKLIPQYQADVQTARQDLQAYLTQHPDPVRGERPTEEQFQIDRLQAAVQAATQRLTDTVSKAEKAKLAGDRSSIDVQQTFSIIDAPQAPAEPSTSRRKLALSAAVFVLAGLLLSAVTVIGEALFDTTLRFPADVQQKLGLPVLGSLPEAVGGRRARRGRKLREGGLAEFDSAPSGAAPMAVGAQMTAPSAGAAATRSGAG